MNSINVIAIFCDDIREEKSEQQTLVGILPDNIVLDRIPGALSRIGFYVRIHAPVDSPLNDVSLIITESDGKIVPLSTFEQSIIEESRKASRDNGFSYVGLVTRALAVPFNVSKAGLVHINVLIDGAEYHAGSLNFIEAQVSSDAT